MESNISTNFIEQIINEDISSGKYNPEDIYTRFPPEPNGYLHIGHAKSICLNYSIAQKYKGRFNLRFDDTNPTKEDIEFVNSIKEDILWLGAKWDGLFFASDYFDKMYEFAVDLIEQGKAYVCDLSNDEMKQFRGDYNNAGKPSPYRDRKVEENLDLFKKMKNGEFEDGSKTLRAKIDFNHPDVIMRDPVIYRIQKSTHHNTGDKWCIYPMYDYAHPIEDALEGITHSICTLEFEAHRPLYNWVVNNLEHHFNIIPQQIEFARLELTNTLMSKRYLRALVEENKVDGWDDPRMPTVCALRRRGVTPEAIRNFAEVIGVTKSNSIIDIGVLEHAIRDDLNLKVNSTMAVLNPIKLTITNYEDNKFEMLEAENNPKNPDSGTRQVRFSKHLYIEFDDFSLDPPAKYKRLMMNEEVRLRHAYFVRLNEVIFDDNGNPIELLCTYDEKTKSGSGFKDRKPKGTIHWVDAESSESVEVREFSEVMVEKDGSLEFNENSLKVYNNARVESSLRNSQPLDRYQFIRNGYYSCDPVEYSRGKIVYNQIVALKSSF